MPSAIMLDSNRESLTQFVQQCLVVQQTSFAAEKSLLIWRWSNDLGWQSTNLPETFEIKEIWGGWDMMLEQNRLLLSMEEQSDTMRMFVSETKDLPDGVLEDREALIAFLENPTDAHIKSWTGHRALLDQLRRYFDLSSTTGSLEAALKPITDRLESRQGDDETPSALLTGFTSEFLFIALARLLILALIFFAVRILTNLYRYFLRLSAYYDARADGLALARAPGDVLKERMPDNVADIFAALSPDTVDLGAPPKGPTTEVLEAATKLADAAARAVSGKAGT